MLTALVTLLLLAAAIWGAYSIAQLLLGPLFWSLRWAATAVQPQMPPIARRRLLGRPPTIEDHLAPTRRTLLARDYELERDGFRINVRTQSRIVRRDGTPSGFPWSRQERHDSIPVVESWLVINAQDRTGPAPAVQIQLGPEEMIFGDEALGAAILDDPMRDALGKGDYLVVEEGLIGLGSPFALEDGRLQVGLDALVRLTHRLLAASYADGRIDTPGLLLENFRSSRRWKSRVDAVEWLMNRFPRSPEAAEALKLSREDPAPAVRYAAARLLGPEALEIVLEVVSSPEAGDGLRQRALRHYFLVATEEQAAPVIQSILLDGREELRRIVLRHVAARRRSSDATWLASLEPLVAGDTAIELAICLGELGDSVAEPALLALYRRNDSELMLAAADALAAVGTPAALATLVPATKTVMQPDLRLAASTAVNLIRSRYAAAEQGALSMPTDQALGEQGSLGYPRAEAGTLSPGKPPGDDPQ